jgi:hypothetical protein
MYIIRSKHKDDFDKRNSLYWNNWLGWIDKAHATKYGAEEKRNNPYLPVETKCWVKIK